MCPWLCRLLWEVCRYEINRVYRGGKWDRNLSLSKNYQWDRMDYFLWMLPEWSLERHCTAVHEFPCLLNTSNLWAVTISANEPKFLDICNLLKTNQWRLNSGKKEQCPRRFNCINKSSQQMSKSNNKQSLTGSTYSETSPESTLFTPVCVSNASKATNLFSKGFPLTRQLVKGHGDIFPQVDN